MRALPNPLRRRRIRGHDAPGFQVPFVVGATRSGTTLLRLMLDSHPELAIPFETHFLRKVIRRFKEGRVTPEEVTELVAGHRRWPDFGLEREDYLSRLREVKPLNAADSIRAFYRLYAEKQGKPRWGDKSPGYVKRMPLISAVLPEARFVHIIRDGRAVAASVVSRTLGPDTVPEAADLWKRRIERARATAGDVPHYLEVRFEDLITDTEPVLRRICEFIELDFDSAMLDYHERARERLGERRRRRHGPPRETPGLPGGHRLTMKPPRKDQITKWRRNLSDDDVRAFEAIAGDLLVELGYEVDGTDPSAH